MNFLRLITLATLSFSALVEAASGSYCNLPPYPTMGGVTRALELATQKNCEAITPADLLKITELDIKDNVRPGNLKGLSNLKVLRISSYADKTYGFWDGSFEGAENLESLEFSSGNTARFSINDDSFKNLTKLKQIKVYIGTGFSGDGFGWVTRNAFAGAFAIQSIDFETYCGEPNDSFNYTWYVHPGAFNGIDSKKIHINSACVRPTN
jgi:hypothetical protein